MYKSLLAAIVLSFSFGCGPKLPTTCNGQTETLTEDCQGILGMSTVVPQLHLRVENANVEIMTEVKNGVDDLLTKLGCTPTSDKAIWNCGTSPRCQ